MINRIEFTNTIIPQLDFIKYTYFNEIMTLFDLVSYSTSINNIYFDPSCPTVFKLEVDNYEIGMEICTVVNNVKQVTKYNEKYEVNSELYNNIVIIHLNKFLG